MRRIWRVIRWLLLIGVGLLVVAQFFGPAKTNPAIDQSQALESHVPVDPKVAAILDRSCKDCHSNKTEWPWYSHVAPVSWFVIDHVDEGRIHLNFSEWGTYDAEQRRDLLRDICTEVKQGSMPLSSYTPLHPGSELTGEDVATICEWTQKPQK